MIIGKHRLKAIIRLLEANRAFMESLSTLHGIDLLINELVEYKNWYYPETDEKQTSLFDEKKQ